MLIIQNLSYTHLNKDLLFSNINFNLNHQDKIGLVGNNGVGKSTLLKLIAQELKPSDGSIFCNESIFYIPQIFGQYNHLTVAQALQIEVPLQALKAILEGDTSEDNFHILNDDWNIEERCLEAMNYWQLNSLQLNQLLSSLSGGQKTKIFLAGIMIHQPKLVLLDEPSNHLDLEGRQLLYDFIYQTNQSLIIVSHDRTLLNNLNYIAEMTSNEIKTYGGNYDFYKLQKQIENEALHHDIHSKEKELRKAKEKERATLERKQKLDRRGKAKQEQSGVSRIMMNTLRNNAEKSTSKLKNTHAEKTENLKQDIQDLRQNVSALDQMKLDFDHSKIHKGKILFKAEQINFSYNENSFLWHHPLQLQINSGERIAIKGRNGSGKTTLIKLILGLLTPQLGKVDIADNQVVYVDQDYSLIQTDLTVYEQAQLFNKNALQESEIKSKLHRFLFTKNDWEKHCCELSGGERMRLLLCCLNIGHQSPDMIILDEPSNNLDIQNIEILTAAINEYQGTLVVISHDENFLSQINIQNIIRL